MIFKQLLADRMTENPTVPATHGVTPGALAAVPAFRVSSSRSLDSKGRAQHFKRTYWMGTRSVISQPDLEA
jgi:hypothetical protein